jgi:hypothetical protein
MSDPHRIEVKPATPNTVAFRAPNRMAYIVVDGKIAALCVTRAIAEWLREELRASGWGVPDER